MVDTMDKVRLDPFRTMLAAKAALHNNARCARKGARGRDSEGQRRVLQAAEGACLRVVKGGRRTPQAWTRKTVQRHANAMGLFLGGSGPGATALC